MKGRPWSREEENELIGLLKAGQDADSIAAKLGKTVDSVVHKMRRLGLKEGAGPTVRPSPSTTCEIVLPDELPTVEDTLRKLAGALNLACQSGLSKTEVQRLQVVANIAGRYEEGLARYMDYRKVEVELERQKKEIDEIKRATEKVRD
jgi:hypothetical protein